MSFLTHLEKASIDLGVETCGYFSASVVEASPSGVWDVHESVGGEVGRPYSWGKRRYRNRSLRLDGK